MQQLFTKEAYAKILNDHIKSGTNLTHTPHRETGTQNIVSVEHMNYTNAIIVCWEAGSGLDTEVVEYGSQAWVDLGQQLWYVKMLGELNTDLAFSKASGNIEHRRIARYLLKLLTCPYPLKSIKINEFNVFTFDV